MRDEMHLVLVLLQILVHSSNLEVEVAESGLSNRPRRGPAPPPVYLGTTVFVL